MTAWPWRRPRMPVILQSEAAECGLACLAMVAGFHGLHCDMTTLRGRFGSRMRGVTLRELMRMAAALGLASRALRVELEELGLLRLPAIVHWDMQHFVVLKAVRGRRVIVCNPALGERSYRRDELGAHLTGVAIELSPTPGFRRGDGRARMRLGDFWERTRGLGASIAQVLVLSALLQGLTLAGPFYMQLVVDEALARYDADLMLVLALGFGLLALLRVTTTALRSWVLLYFGQMLSFGMATHLFRHLLHLPLTWFAARHVGDISSRFGSLAPIQKLITEGLVATLLDALMALATLTLMLIYAPWLALLSITALVVYGIARGVLYPVLRARTAEQIAAGARADTTFIETLRAMQAIRIFAGELDREALWQNRQIEVVNAAVRVGGFGIAVGALHGLIFALENVGVIWLGAREVLAGSFSIGMLYAYVAYKGQFADRVAALIDRLVEVRMLGLHLERLGDIGLAEPELEPGRGVVRRTARGELGLEDAWFRHDPEGPWLLQGARFHAAPGELVVICGVSGCGKSTLLRVLLGLHPLARGRLLVDGVAAAEFGLGDFRMHVAAVMQDDTLLSGTLAENITFFDPEPDYAAVTRCARAAAVDDDIEHLPMGYDTPVSDMGASLSGGQRQRLLLARALYRQPRYLFLDEGTAHLDPDAAVRVHDNLQSLGMTRIVVTHAPAALPRADRVYRLAAGRLEVLR